MSLRAVTVWQPWAWLIIYGGKNVENRSRRAPWYTAVGERVAVHAGLVFADDANVYEAARLARFEWSATPYLDARGAILGTVVVTSVHHADACGCTSPWAQPDAWHLTLADPRPWVVPLAARGARGLWEVEHMPTRSDVERGPTITCPECGRTSWNPNDVSEGYCGACHDWTSERTS